MKFIRVTSFWYFEPKDEVYYHRIKLNVTQRLVYPISAIAEVKEVKATTAPDSVLGNEMLDVHLFDTHLHDHDTKECCPRITKITLLNDEVYRGRELYIKEDFEWLTDRLND